MTNSVIGREAAADGGIRIRVPSRRQLAILGLGIVLGLAAAWYGYRWWTVARFVESTDDAYVGGNVTPIAPHVSGFVAKILVTDNQYVRAGQPLVRLDRSDFRTTLRHAEAVVRQREAALADVHARYILQQALIRRAAAHVAAKRATAVFAAENDVRYEKLAHSEAGSRQAAQKTLATDRAAQAAVVSAKATLAASRQQLAVLGSETAAARANLAAAEAVLQNAQLDLSYTTVRAPINGYVGNRSAQVGAYVTAGTYLLSIVPARGLWVDANFKEDELAHIKPGDSATIVADVLPGRTFYGHVVSLAPAAGAIFSVIPPQNATGNFTKIVQRVPVRIALEGKAAVLGMLRPGLSTTVSIDTRPAGP